jgi:hypothetical protein
MLVFDKWTCNTNGRQTLFYRASENSDGRHSPGGNRDTASPEPESSPAGFGAGFGARERYSTVMIDQGFCFNAGEWNYPDAPLRGLYARNRVYEGVTGMESFAPWIRRVENFTDRVLQDFAKEVPPEWYYDDFDALKRLLEQLLRRVKRLEELILDAKRSNRQPFPNWR